jgi:hypothetical protein
VNSGTGAGPGECPQIDHRIITVSLAHGALYPSAISLPLAGDRKGKE